MPKLTTAVPALGVAIAAAIGLLAFLAPQLLISLNLPFDLEPYLSKLHSATPPLQTTSPSQNATAPTDEPFVCIHHPYTTSIVSLNPLVIYLSSFISPHEISLLLEAGDDSFNPSNVHRSGRNQVYNSRTSTTAALSRSDPVANCVLARARQFMGTMFDDEHDDMGVAQLVRYVEGQKFDVHHDWFDGVQTWAGIPGQTQEEIKRKERKRWNRGVSFFGILEDGCEEGETWFPKIAPAFPQPAPAPPPSVAEEDGDGLSEEDKERMKKAMRDMLPPWREHPDGGIGFRPIAGNAIFWVNLHANGTGDGRTVHAGLPVTGGRKTAMNIWPKKFFEDKVKK